MRTFVKRAAGAPRGFFACEAAGLRWLRAAGGARCVEVIAADASSLTLTRLDSVAPTPAAARAFGAALARTHDAGAPGWGAAPAGWDGPGYFGPLQHPLPMSYAERERWGDFYADERLAPMLELARPVLGATADVRAVIDRCRAGDYDDDDQPARLHGDLWSGNLLWTADGATLIDPAAHGGHRETDLAMLELFGCPHRSEVLAGYNDAHPLRPGWGERIGLHQLYPLLAHVVLFGAGYAGQAGRAVRSALALPGRKRGNP